MALNDIIRDKKIRIAQDQQKIESMRKSLTPSRKSLFEALTQEKSSFIFEIKPASPSKGVIKKNADIEAIAKDYAPFATAISVLADEKYFGGSYANVKKVSEAHSCPVLCKDVVVSPLQIYEARYFSADAVLLMLSVLSDDEYIACEKIAKDLAMDVITEVHSDDEMQRAKKLNAQIIGINNRNLKTLEIDLETTERLLSKAPKNALVISESGFENRAQIHRFSPWVDGFLVGSALMKKERIDLAVRELLFGRVKICGLTNREDAQNAYLSGAYYGGLNFSSQSKRCVNVDEARDIKLDVPLLWGGIFVNQPIGVVHSTAETLKLNFVQIHGDENENYLTDLRAVLPKNCEVWRAHRVTDNVDVKSTADRILLDSYSSAHYGGTGKSFDWKILNAVSDLDRFVIAGGINPANVKTAANLSAFALDIASGVEDDDNPRKKSLIKINELFNNLWP